MPIDWKQYDADETAEQARREGYRSNGCYTDVKCENCGRLRVMVCRNGKHVCEKCHWDADAHDYDYFHLDQFS